MAVSLKMSLFWKFRGMKWLLFVLPWL
jgi:hypothetical protein